MVELGRVCIGSSWNAKQLHKIFMKLKLIRRKTCSESPYKAVRTISLLILMHRKRERRVSVNYCDRGLFMADIVCVRNLCFETSEAFDLDY